MATSSGANNSPANTPTSVQVNYYAQPAFSVVNTGTPGTNPSGAIVGGMLFLNVAPGSNSSAGVLLTNTQLDATYQDTLGGSFGTTPANGVAYNNFNTLANGSIGIGGSTTAGTLSYTSANPGASGSLTLTATSTNGSGTTPLSGLTLNVQLVSTQQTTLTSSNGAPYQFSSNANYVTTWSVQSNGSSCGNANSYLGLTSGVNSQGNGSSLGAPGAGVGPQLTTDGHGNNLYAQILAGYNSGAYTSGTSTVSMQWRNRSLQETDPQDGGTPASPPLQYVGSYLISNVLNLSGLGTSGNSKTYTSTANTTYFGSSSVTEHQTDPFVLQLNYAANLLSGEAGQAKKGTVFVGWLAPAGFQVGGVGTPLAAPEWLNAVTGDFDTSGAQNGFAGIDAVTKYQGSFNAFLAAEFGAGVNSTNVTPTELAEVLGSWGVDVSNHDVWTVINHNSQFAVVPEPSTLLLAALGIAGLASYRMRRRRT